MREFRHRYGRQFEDTRRDCEAIRPLPTVVFDFRRGEERLMAEVFLAEQTGQDVPSFARERATSILERLARE